MSKRKTHEQFLIEMKELHPFIEILGVYKDYHTPVKCKCLIDGYEWEGKPSKMISSKHGCPKCGKSLPLNSEMFRQQMAELNPDIEILGEYVNINTPLEVSCKKCGYKWKARPYHLKDKKGCPVCANKKNANKNAKKIEDFKREMKEIDSTIDIVGTYKNSKTKIECHCKICGKTWFATPSNLLKNRGCPSCVASKGEKRVSEWLKENKINFNAEYRINDCCYNRPLIFDFYISDYNVAIEYDGHQHFFPVRFGGISQERAEEIFKETQIRDKIKNEYCLKNDIKILRISYKDYNNINNILKKFFLNILGRY